MAIWLAPAKLNLFLHVVGKRADGYHLLQSVFQFVDLFDELEFKLRQDGEIRQGKALAGIPAEQDLAIMAARALQRHTGCHLGVEISLSKQIPTGAGLGGGSSNAATTLLALNELWQLRLSRQELAELGVKLGADVPVFIRGHNAWAEGIGEQLTPITLPASYFVIVIPPVHVSTAEIFSNLKLTRGAKTIKIRDFQAGLGDNHLQRVTCKLYPQVQQAFDWLARFGEARMSGSGAAIFMIAQSADHAAQVARQCPVHWQVICARGLSEHPHG